MDGDKWINGNNADVHDDDGSSSVHNQNHEKSIQKRTLYAFFLKKEKEDRS